MKNEISTQTNSDIDKEKNKKKASEKHANIKRYFRIKMIVYFTVAIILCLCFIVGIIVMK